MVHNGMLVRVGAGPMRTTGLQGALMICSYVAVTAWLAVLAMHFTQRYRLADDGRARPRLWEHQTILMVVVLGAFYLVAMSMTAWWSYAVVSNVERLGERRVSATWAARSWFIPIAWFTWGFTQLRKAPRVDWPVWAWQASFVSPFVVSWFLLRFFARRESRDLNDFGGTTAVTQLQELQSAMLVSWAFVGGSALACVMALRAVAMLRVAFRLADEASAAVGA